MVKKFIFILIAFFCLISIHSFSTPPQPAYASTIAGEPCVIWWVDKSVAGYPLITWTDVASCPHSCFIGVAGDYYNQSDTWCADEIAPPNIPGVFIGNACSGSSSRTVTLITDRTNGTSFDVEGNGQVIAGTSSFTFTNLPEGLFTARGQAHNSGGSSGWSAPVTAQQDYSPPTTSHNFVGLTGYNGWYISPVTVSFDRNDVGCLGVSQTVYAVNGTQGNYTGAPFVVSNEGPNSLQYLSTDGANTEAEKSAVFGIDTVQPSLTIFPDSPANSSGWWNEPVSVYIFADDATSGIDTVQQDVNGSGLTPYSIPVVFNTDGVHTIDAQVTDRAGNMNYDGVVIQLDSTAPTLVPTVTGTQNGTTWYISAPTMTVSATDATSGVAGLGYTVNGGGFNLYSSPVIFNTDGVYDIQLIALDNAQNSTTESIQIQFDSTAPQMSINLVGDKGQNGWFISPPAFAVTASDTTSDVGSMGYNIENGGWNPYTNPVKITREGLYSISVEVRDNATNSTSHTFQIGYDITPPQTSATLTETADGMVVTLNRWDGVSGYALTRVAINGVWQDYHHPITISEKGEYWVQYFTTDFVGNIEAEKITSFTIEDTGVVIIQNPPVVNIIPPSNPPNTPPFETNDDFPPNLGDETIFYVSPPPPVIISTPPTFSDDNRVSNNSDGQHTTNTNLGVHGDPPRISRPPFFREDTPTLRLNDVFPLEAHFPPGGNPPRLSVSAVMPVDYSEHNNISTNDVHIIRTDYGILEGRPPRIKTIPTPIEYVEHPVAFVPTDNSIISNPTTGTSVPENAPLDITMIAMLGLTMAGAGMMKSESARKKQDELAKAEAVAAIGLATALAEQKESAQENWANNQAMRAEAKQQVYTKVQQSQANKDFWSAYTAWQKRVAEVEQKRRQEALKAQTKPIVVIKKPTTNTTQKTLPANPLLAFFQNVTKAFTSVVNTVTRSERIQELKDNYGVVFTDEKIWDADDIASVYNATQNTDGAFKSLYDRNGSFLPTLLLGDQAGVHFRSVFDNNQDTTITIDRLNNEFRILQNQNTAYIPIDANFERVLVGQYGQILNQQSQGYIQSQMENANYGINYRETLDLESDFANWVYNPTDYPQIERWVAGGIVYTDLLENGDSETVLNKINTLVGIGSDNLPESELQISVGLDLARHIAQDEYPQGTANPRDKFSIAETESLNWYESALGKSYSISIIQGRDVPDENISNKSPVNYEVLRNYEIGLDNLARLYDSVITDYGYDLNRYELYQQVMGNMQIVRTTSRTGIEKSLNAYGYNEGIKFNDIFDTDRGSMSPLNFTHELLHSFHKFSGMGNDQDEFSPINRQWFWQDGTVVAEINWEQRALANMDIVDKTLIPSDEILTVESKLIGITAICDISAYNLQIRSDTTSFSDCYRERNYDFATFRQNTERNSTPLEGDDTLFGRQKEILVDAMTYAAYGLFDQVGETATFSEELKQRIAMSIRQAVLFHTPPSDYATVVFDFEEPLQIINTGVDPFNMRINSPSLEGTIQDDGDINLPDRRTYDTNRTTYTVPEGNGIATVLTITQQFYSDSRDEGEYQWVYVGNSQNQYSWIREDSIRAYNINWESIPTTLPSEPEFAPFEVLDPYRPFASDDPFNPPFLNNS